MGDAQPVYASDPHASPDDEFVPGDLSLIVAGNRGRLLDARRTPVTIAAIEMRSASFRVRIDAFEDAGAHWLLALEDIVRFQFQRDSARASAVALAAYAEAVARLDRPAPVPADPAAREQTLLRLAAAREQAAAWLEAHAAPLAGDVDVAAAVAAREGDPSLYELLALYLTERGLHEMDRSFAETFVSNPRSGELVKGHAIVLAQLGLCAYQGRAVRDPSLLHGEWSPAARAEHLIARLAFTQSLWERLGFGAVTLYRGMASERPIVQADTASLVSATFSSAVADAHFQGGPSTLVAAIWRQVVPVAALLMTFLETEAMNRRYREAEAVLLAEPGNCAF